MKLRCSLHSLPAALIAALALSLTACKSNVPVTKIPNPGAGRTGSGSDFSSGTTPISSDHGLTARDIASGVPLADPANFADMSEDPSALQGYTVHFDYDSSSVKPGEESNVSSVAEQLKSRSGTAVRIAGHCDERGTEEYNRALGERRALALRDKLLGLGIGPNRIDTRSYGED